MPFLNISWVNRDLMITPFQVQLAEDPGPCQTACDVRHVWQRIAVLLGDDVEAAVISTRSPGSVAFHHHVKGAGPVAVGSADYSLLFQALKFCFCCSQLDVVQPSELGCYWTTEVTMWCSTLCVVGSKAALFIDYRRELCQKGLLLCCAGRRRGRRWRG